MTKHGLQKMIYFSLRIQAELCVEGAEKFTVIARLDEGLGRGKRG